MMTWGQYLLSTQFVLMMTGLSLAAAAAWIMLVAMRESADDNRETDRALATKRQRSAARASYRASASDFSRPNHQGTASDATSAEPAAAGAAGGAAVSHSDKVTTARGVDAQQTKSKTVHKSIETRALDTEHGPLTVTIEGDDTMLSTIVTVHDVGNNHRTCFNALFQVGAKRFRATRVIHVTVPGQSEGDATLHTFPSLDTIATRISDALEMMNIRRCTGIGVGAGANILLRIARDNPIVLNGIVAIAPSRKRPSIQESMYSLYLEGLLATVGLNAIARKAIIRQHCSRAAYRNGVSRDLDAALCDMNPANVRAFAKAYRQRNELSAEDLASIATEAVPLPPTENEATDLYRLTKFQLSCRIPMRYGDWITAEAPYAMIEPLELFFGAVGI